MTDYVRMIAVGGTIGVLVAGTLATPAFIGAFAEEPVAAVASTIEELFPAPFDPDFFTKYAINFDETVSTDIQSSNVVKKIAFGHKSSVTIVTTPSGTYSSDGLVSPNIRYPGIEVTPKHQGERDSFALSTATSRQGTRIWSSFTRGSITYYTYSYTPATRT